MRISITDRCNLRCRYCMPEGIEQVSMKEILTYEEILTICRAAVRAGITKFKVTGGEPLVRLGCADLIRQIKEIPGAEQVTITTNGVLLAKYLPELMASGLDAVNISLDTLNPEKYRSITARDEFESVVEGIRKATFAGLNVKINTVLQRGMNDEEWKDLADLTKDYPLDVRFIEMMPIGSGRDYEPIYNDELLDRLKEAEPGLIEDNSVHGNGPAVYYRMSGAKGSVGFISAMHGKFCSSCNRIRLTSMGKLKPCLCFGDTIDVKRALRGSTEDERDEKVYEAVMAAIDMKPEQHRFEEIADITEAKQMVEIGG